MLRQVFPTAPGRHAPARTPVRTWIDRYATRLPAVRTVSTGPGDDIWVAGRFSAPLALGATTLANDGISDVFVARLDPLGRPRWARALGGPGDHACGGIALDAEGNVIVAYQESGPVTLAKLGPDGDLLWEKSLAMPGGDEIGGWLRGAGSDRAGGMMVVLGGVEGNNFVVRADANGDVLWTRAIPKLAEKDPIGLAVDSEGSAVVGAGSQTGGSDRLWKVTSAGCVWAPVLFHGHDGFAAFQDIGADRLGNVLLSGGMGASFVGRPTPREHQHDPWIAKLRGGTVLWEVFGVAGRVAADDAGNVLYANAESVGKLDPQGRPVWQHAIHIDGDVGAVAADSAGRVIYAGCFDGRADFGDGPVDSGEHTALFVAAFAS